MPIDTDPIVETQTDAHTSDSVSVDVNDSNFVGQVPLEGKVTIYSSVSEIRNPVKLLREIFAGFVNGRELAWRIFVRNLNSLYRQTALGLFWAFLPPLANTAIWIFLKSQNVFEMGDTGVDSTVYILAGMILWQVFVDAFQIPADVLNKNKSMISRLNFPRESLLLVGFGEVMFNLAIRVTLLIPAFLFFGVSLNMGALLAPVAIVFMACFGMAIGLFLMPIGSLYKDIGRFIAMFVPFWMIITPIIYVPAETFPGTLLNWVNPASPLLLVSRDLLLTGETSHAMVGLIFGFITIPLLLIGLIIYRVSLPILIERMPN